MNQLVFKKKNELTQKKKKGFTLVELIIVIAIIAILAAIAIPKFGEVTRNANIKADIASAKNIHGITAQLIAEGNIIPGTTATTDIQNLVADKIDGAKTKDSKKIMPTTKVDKSVSFSVAVESNGDIKVNSGSTEIYPNSEDYAKISSKDTSTQTKN